MNKNKSWLAIALYAAMQATSPAIAAAPLGSSWTDVAKLPDFFTGNWQSATWMLDGPSNVAYTEAAKKYIAHYQPIEDLPFAGANCKTPGMPIAQRAGSPLKFFYQPGLIAIYIENNSMTRFIKLNAAHSARPNPTYLGESVGHFEGDTLVVDSIGFVDDIALQYGVLPGHEKEPMVQIPSAIFGPHGPNLRMVERFRMLDADTLEVRLTVHDDTVWKQPYVSNPVQLFKRNRGDAGWPNEWVCSSAFIMPFDSSTNKTVEQDPAEILKQLRKSEIK